MIRITKYSNFENIKSDIEVLKTDLDSVKKTYLEALENVNGSISSVDFSSWNDDIEKELSSYLSGDFKSDCDKISNDLSGGNYVTLYNSVTNLISELNFCIDCKKRIDSKKAELAETDKKVPELDLNRSYYGVEGYSEPKYVDNNAYVNLSKELDELKKELDKYVENCNGFLKTIASITFVGTFDKVNVNTGVPDASLPSACYNKIPDNLSDDYHPDIYIDSTNGIDFAGLWILNRNFSNTDAGLHFVYNESDKCYYEVNQNVVGTSDTVPFENIPEGESPRNYGYVPHSCGELMKAKVVGRGFG